MKKHFIFIFIVLFAFSCGEDVKESDDGSRNVSDVAVTSDVSKIGFSYALINGYVNLNQIS